ncbi:MAG TPA: aminofutalosine synthase MqnE, partial [Chitinophagaceae bacterium]|nr:aminofutalosine synthase MqnE [Chitinophagaceae bacterium]
MTISMQTDISALIAAQQHEGLQAIGTKVLNHERLTPAEGLLLFTDAPLAYVGALANWKREQLHGNKTYFNRNFHIEPTNVCVFSCKFCSYSRLYAHREEGWELSIDQMLD